MLVFYDAPVSGNTYKVRLLLRQLKREHQVVRLDIVGGEVRTDAFRKLNPFGRVPYIVDGDFGLAESNAILLYLARGTEMLPVDPRQQALVQQWMFYEQIQIALSIGLPRLWRKFQVDIPQAVFDHYAPRGRAALKDLERHLANTPWLVGDRYTVADIALYAYTHMAEDAGHDLAALPAVSAWLDRVRAQPGFIALE
jgi:glutathione S-transferase